MPAKRSKLPKPTPEQIRNEAARLRGTPGGGWAWKCAYCGQYASSKALSGKYVCYQHGGDRAIQRDRVKRPRMRDVGQEPPAPSGRPIQTGWYSNSERMEARTLIAEYEAARLEIDDTDRDMLFLRARIENMLAMETCVTTIAAELQEGLVELREWRRQHVEPAEGWTVASVLEELDRLSELRDAAQQLGQTLRGFLGYQEQIEFRHREVIRAAKVRAETRLKNRAAQELGVFSAFLERLLVILGEQMPPEAFQALLTRLRKDLEDLPTRLVDLPSGKRHMA